MKTASIFIKHIFDTFDIDMMTLQEIYTFTKCLEFGASPSKQAFLSIKCSLIHFMINNFAFP